MCSPVSASLERPHPAIMNNIMNTIENYTNVGELSRLENKNKKGSDGGWKCWNAKPGTN